MPPRHGLYYCTQCRQDHRLDNSKIGPRHYKYRRSDVRTNVFYPASQPRRPGPSTRIFVPEQRRPIEPTRRTSPPAPKSLSWFARRRLKRDVKSAQTSAKQYILSKRGPVAGAAVQYVFDQDGFYEDIADKLIERSCRNDGRRKHGHELCVLLNDAAKAVDGSTYADIAGEGIERGLKRLGVDDTVAIVVSAGGKIAIKKAFDATTFGQLPKAFRGTIPLVCPNLSRCPAESEVLKTYGSAMLAEELKNVAEGLGVPPVTG